MALPAGVEASNGSNAGATATAVLLINEVAGNVGKSVLFGAHSNVEFSASAKDVLDAVQKAKGSTLFVDGVDLGYLFAEKSGMKKLLPVSKTSLYSQTKRTMVSQTTHWYCPLERVLRNGVMQKTLSDSTVSHKLR